ncbi:circadian clock KaiB family protein [Hymenobacter tibetensis]|uniref:Circadian clock KaiB family protein n=1 Tax=Hymenobacter tibetensis TaxID=497967 RepID=A0ABY4CXD9_9BACT|nr:circadian clock KaiB family protein [Hymenobacter tibetensis]UOG74707.1 circadian clock KaiB family protein [Hymenobacter tibetensis]
MESDERQPESSAEYVLYLYISGATPNSTRAVRNIKEICDLYLKGRHELVIVDIYQQPELAQGEQLIGIPTLIKKRPGLVRRLVGDLSNRPRVLAALGLSDALPSSPTHG